VAHSLSAKKRVRQGEKRRTINRARKSQVKTMTKRFDDALDNGDLTLASDELKSLCSKLDKTGTTSTMHKKTVARQKSRLTLRLNAVKAKEAS